MELFMGSRWVSALCALSVAATAIGCSDRVDVDDIPVGSDVQVTRSDGGVVEGKLASRDQNAVQVDTGSVTRAVPRDEIADVQPVEASKPAELPPVAKFREYTIPSGTEIELDLETPVTTETARVGEPVRASLRQAVRLGSTEVVPAGAIVHGEVGAVQAAGKVKGRASVTLAFSRLEVGGESFPINARYGAIAPATKEKDAQKIALPAAGGAIVGGLLGGKKGAAIGAAVGAGAGTAHVLSTPGKEIELGRGADMTVVLAGPVDVRVPIKR
jgi:hypothetical protein